MAVERRDTRNLDNRHLLETEVIIYHNINIIEFYQFLSTLELLGIDNSYRNANHFHILHYLKTVSSAWVILTFNDLLLWFYSYSRTIQKVLLIPAPDMNCSSLGAYLGLVKLWSRPLQKSGHLRALLSHLMVPNDTRVTAKEDHSEILTTKATPILGFCLVNPSSQ